MKQNNFRDAGHARWAKEVKAKDHYKCTICNANSNLESHHKNSWSGFPEDRYDVSNGTTMCEYHHIWLHRVFSFNSIYWHYDQYKDIHNILKKIVDESAQTKEIKEVFKNILQSSSNNSGSSLDKKDK